MHTTAMFIRIRQLQRSSSTYDVGALDVSILPSFTRRLALAKFSCRKLQNIEGGTESKLDRLVLCY